MIGIFLKLTLSSASFVAPILSNIFMFFDAIIYAIADESYKIFEFAATRFNLNSIGGVLDAIVKRVMTLVAVFMLFRLLMILIQYIIEPDKVKDQKIGGGKVINNVVVTVVMLTLVYSGFLFGIMHDLQFLIFGDSKSQYEVIGDWGFTNENENVIRNIIFGVQEDEFDNFGRELASDMLGNFLYLDEGNGSSTRWKDLNATESSSTNRKLFYNIANGGKSFFDLFYSVDLSDSQLRYYPFISAIGGLFMIYTFFKYAIEIIVRALKLFVMEMVAPIAVVAYIDPGKGKQVFDNYFKTYFSIYLELFIRIALVYLSVVFIKVGVQGVLTANALDDMGIIAKGILYVLSIIATFRFIGMAPKLISDVFGIKMDEKKGGFGKMLGAVAGTAIGTGVGLTSALRSGAGGWAAAYQAVSGGIQGGMSGGSAKNLGGFTSGISKTAGGISSRSYKISSMGGLRNYAGGAAGTFLGGNQAANHSVAELDKKIGGLDKKAETYSQGDTLRQNLDNAINDEYAKRNGSLDYNVERLKGIYNRDEVRDMYERGRNMFADEALSGQIDVDAIKRAQQQYNEHVSKNSSLDGYKDASGGAITITDSASIETSKIASRDASDAIAHEKITVQQKQKDIKEGRVKMKGSKDANYVFNSSKAQQRRAQQYKNNEAYKSEKK